MKHYYPAYYKGFRCIAADCPDSCCQGWDVVIDSDTEAYYNAVKGAFGDRLRGAIFTDPDGDRVFRLAEAKKCPFWGNDKLCEIYRELGEEHLCATCALFPRIRMAYADFTEHTLALACPEAARLILATDSAYRSFDHIAAAGCEDYSEEEIAFLLQARREAARILTASAPLEERLRSLTDFAQQAQRELCPEDCSGAPISPAAIYAELEYIDEGNRARFAAAAQRPADLTVYERELTRLALYWLYRYCLGAIDSLDVLAPIRFLIISVEVVAGLARDCGDIVVAAQTYSKEIEQSYENMEALWDAFVV